MLNAASCLIFDTVLFTAVMTDQFSFHMSNTLANSEFECKFYCSNVSSSLSLLIKYAVVFLLQNMSRADIS